jgi:hypothetical protein
VSARITAAEKAALPVARAALESRQSAYGTVDAIVFALGAAGLLATPEVVEAFDTAEAEEYPAGRVARLRTALGVMQAARRRQPDGLVPLVWALENACLLQSPETAAELLRLRTRVVELETAARAGAGIFRQIADQSEPEQWPGQPMLLDAAAQLDRIAAVGEPL